MLQQDTFAESDSLPLPDDRSLLDAKDLTGQFAEITKGNPVSQEAKYAFLAARHRLAAARPGLTPEQARATEAAVFGSAGRPSALAERPTPGGVGYGMFYTDAFKTGFASGTRLLCQYICPPVAGGSVKSWLYLTSMNRASLGVEAVVCYYAQDEPVLMGYDWARQGEDRWQINVPFSRLSEYLLIFGIDNQDVRGLAVLNMTWQTSPGVWRNSVSLLNYVSQRYDLVYSYQYQATPEDQKKGTIGSWGPIVETFEPSYSKTKPMGVRMTFLSGMGQNGQWNDLSLLSPDQSTLREDHVGFRRIFLAPNFTWAVES